MNLTDKQALELIEDIAMQEGFSRIKYTRGLALEDEGMGKIYRIVHSQNHLCLNTHEDWQEEAVKLYQEMAGRLDG